ncbi:MAG: methyltransferase RsmF C-terminal domain-like protein, partial [Bacilli bacterium]
HLEDTYTLWPQGDLLYAAPRDLANHLRTAIAPAKQRPPDSRRRTSARLQSEDPTSAYSSLFLRIGLPLVRTAQRHVVPTHSLAMALKADDALHPLRFAYGDPAILAYLRGEPIASPPGAPPGWTLVTMAGAGIGWGKISDGILKNHYPKGLRRAYRFAAP